MAKYDNLPADSNMTRLPGWNHGSATPAPLVPKWAGQFDTFERWVNAAPRSLTGAVGSAGQDVRAICVDAKGRRCSVGRDFRRARDEGAFPVRYFWDCEPLGPIAQATVAGWEIAHDCLQAVEYAANHIVDDAERGDFIRAFVDGDDLADGWPEFAAWRAERLAGMTQSPTTENDR